MEITPVNECPVPKGVLLIIGGKENKDGEEPGYKETPNGFVPLEILKKFIELTEKQDASIEVITTASSEGQESFEEYKKFFNENGINKIGHIHHNERMDVLNDELEQRVNEANGVFFSGGDQLLLTSVYGGTPFLTHLKQRYINDKIVIGGTSAGAMALSTPMIYAGNEEVHELAGEIKITTGMEFMKDVCIDTHFVHRGRFIRLAQVIVTNPTCVGVGIEEDTALIVREGREAEVIGSGTLIIIDGFEVTRSNASEMGEKKPVSIRNLRVHILAKGDKYIFEQVNPPHI
jgi:cyanophycinase